MVGKSAKNSRNSAVNTRKAPEIPVGILLVHRTTIHFIVTQIPGTLESAPKNWHWMALGFPWSSMVFQVVRLLFVR